MLFTYIDTVTSTKTQHTLLPFVISALTTKQFCSFLQNLCVICSYLFFVLSTILKRIFAHSAIKANFHFQTVHLLAVIAALRFTYRCE